MSVDDMVMVAAGVFITIFAVSVLGLLSLLVLDDILNRRRRKRATNGPR